MLDHYRLIEERYVENPEAKKKFSVSMQHYTFAVEAFIQMAKVKPWKLAQLSARVFGTDPFQYTEEESALILSDKLKEFFVHLGLKVTLKKLGIGREHFSEMADRATKGGTQTVGHYVFLAQKEILEILEAAQPK